MENLKISGNLKKKINVKKLSEKIKKLKAVEI